VTSISINLPENVFSDIDKQPNEFVQEMRIAAAIKWYELGTVSRLQAAEIAGLSCSEFTAAVSRYQIAPLPEDTPHPQIGVIENHQPRCNTHTKLSLQEIAALPIEERHKLLVPFIAATAQDFLNDPELTEY
jgi:predicted HTH domain antitoxin